ncbi:hypothetical protein I79_023372 [Cricetulus griseus]|uniref:Uncharacterized protein n=1 Tax=Cricetulus griseus TaxID=10029 RepID=G3IHR7_CRIGR|nr:hypothetical protein I79_023372 [Cricetulus griseus]
MGYLLPALLCFPLFPGPGLVCGSETWAQVTGLSLASWSLYAAVSPFPALPGYRVRNLSDKWEEGGL